MLIGRVQDLRTGGRWFDLRLSQYSFRGLMIVIATRSIVLTMILWESSNWLGKNIVLSAIKKKGKHV